MEILLVSCTDMFAFNDIFVFFCTEMRGKYYSLFEIRMYIFGASKILVIPCIGMMGSNDKFVSSVH